MSEYLSQPNIKEELIDHKELLKGVVPTVVKIGGSVAVERVSTLSNIAFLHKQIGIPLVIVHGGGAEIDSVLIEQGIKSQRVDGLRVTDGETLRVVISVLNGINHQLVTVLQDLGVKATGFTADSGLLQAVIEDPRLGFVGKVSSVNSDGLKACLEEGVIPVITPIATMQGSVQFLNINGDTAAGAIAASLGANLILVTDVPGVKDGNGIVIPQINNDLYKQMLANGIITFGMLPKLEAGFHAADLAVKVSICQAGDLLHFFTDKPRGTLISNKLSPLGASCQNT